MILQVWPTKVIQLSIQPSLSPLEQFLNKYDVTTSTITQAMPVAGGAKWIVWMILGWVWVMHVEF
jgi:hypothetical protein